MGGDTVGRGKKWACSAQEKLEKTRDHGVRGRPHKKGMLLRNTDLPENATIGFREKQRQTTTKTTIAHLPGKTVETTSVVYKLFRVKNTRNALIHGSQPHVRNRTEIDG